VHTQECLIEVCTLAATHNVIGQLFPFSALVLVQDEGDQAVVGRATGGATVLEVTVGLPPRPDVQIIWQFIHHLDPCITSVFNACTPR
jgi:hypothetical protein